MLDVPIDETRSVFGKRKVVGFASSTLKMQYCVNKRKTICLGSRRVKENNSSRVVTVVVVVIIKKGNNRQIQKKR